jgi:hypothetical protein
VRPALIFCQSHEEFGCCFWFHMAHCTIHASSANKAENSSALLCLMCHAALRMLLVCVNAAAARIENSGKNTERRSTLNDRNLSLPPVCGCCDLFKCGARITKILPGQSHEFVF